MSVPDYLFLLAAALSVLGALAHELAGAPKVLRPLKGAGLDDGVAALHHFSWHVGTVAVLAMVAEFLLAVWHPAGEVFALIATLTSAGFAVLAILLASTSQKALWRTPAPYPWTLIALLGGLGLWLG